MTAVTADDLSDLRVPDAWKDRPDAWRAHVASCSDCLRSYAPHLIVTQLGHGMSSARRQKIYGVSALVREQYRLLRLNPATADEARLMTIGACVLDRADTYTSKEWVVRPTPRRA